MEIKSEKVLYGEKVKEELAYVDVELILWGEDLTNSKVVVFPNKINDIPRYEKIQKNLVKAAIVYFDFDKQKFVKFSIVRCDCDNEIIYISKGNFNVIWKYLRKSVDLGMRIQKEEARTQFALKKAEDILDLSLLYTKRGIPIISKGQISIVTKELSPEEKISQGKKQSLLDNKSNKYFYSSEESNHYYHDRDCDMVKRISPECFIGSETIPEGRRPCKWCKRRIFIRELCSPYVKIMPTANRFLTQCDIKDNYIAKIAFNYKFKFRIDALNELTVISKEDTWIIKGFDSNCLSLWHNNYVTNEKNERLITQGFHNQGLDGKKLFTLFEYINGYSFSNHVKADEKVGAEQDIIEVETVVKKESIAGRIISYFRKLIGNK